MVSSTIEITVKELPKSLPLIDYALLLIADVPAPQANLASLALTIK
jgi:hypothetical protein